LLSSVVNTHFGKDFVELEIFEASGLTFKDGKLLSEQGWAKEQKFQLGFHRLTLERAVGMRNYSDWHNNQTCSFRGGFCRRMQEASGAVSSLA